MWINGFYVFVPGLPESLVRVSSTCIIESGGSEKIVVGNHRNILCKLLERVGRIAITNADTGSGIYQR